ncbi:MAG TPA: hypothetical protein VHC47_04735 [Mucilaginibacter sp.]|nr:hypothetical protein [Mucilaginibacter sp.]
MKFVKIFVAALALFSLQIASASASQVKHHHFKHHKPHHRIHRHK